MIKLRGKIKLNNGIYNQNTSKKCVIMKDIKENYENEALLK